VRRAIDNLQIKSTISQRRTARVSQVRRHLKPVNSIEYPTATHPTKTEIDRTWFIIVKICQSRTSGRTKNMSLNLPLPDSIQNFINEQLAIGDYSNAVEYILHLIRQEQARAARVESLLLAGLDSGNSIEITDDWWEPKRAQLVQKLDRQQQ
jgi:antitoxin ParD1/3/4